MVNRLSSMGLGLAALVAISPAQSGSALAGDPFDMEWRELAEGVWAGVRPNSYYPPVLGTPVIVIGEAGVLLFDPAGAALQGERVAAKVAELTDLPVTHMAVSHWHGDHSLGLYKILEKHPDAEVIAHEFTARAFISPIMGDNKAPDAETQKAERARLETALRTGKRSNGEPFTPAIRAYYQNALDHFDLVNAELDRSKTAAPTKTFADRLLIDLGGRRVELIHLGPGNTNGDIILHLPKERIVAAGDAIVRPTPYGFFSHPRSWIEVLEKIKALKPRVVIPGHGEIMRDLHYVDLLAESLTLVVDQTEAAVRAGKSLDETRALIDWARVEPRFIREESILAVFFDGWFKTPIVEAAYAEARGEESEKLNPDPPAPQ